MKREGFYYMKTCRLVLAIMIVFLVVFIISGCQSPLEDLGEEINIEVEYLVYSSGESYEADIYIMKDDGTIVSPLTNNSDEDFQPAWAPDGSEIAFVSDRSGKGDAIYVMNPEGSGVSEVISPIEDITNISWAPDGNSIIYSGNNGSGDDDIYYYNFTSQSGSALISDSYKNSSPDYSPGGDQFVFSSDRLTCGTNLFIGENDGSIPVQLTAFSENDNYKYFPGEPAWSQDGDKIAFSLGIYDKNEEKFYSNICTIDTDGNNFKKLTNTTEGHNVAPAWSADGSRIAFASIYEAGDIFIMNADGTKSRKLTDSTTGTYSTQPSWAPANFEMN